MSETRNKTKKITNKILAMLVAAPAMLVKPKTPATSATNRNITVQPSISDDLYCKICAKRGGNCMTCNRLKSNIQVACKLQPFVQNAHKFDRRRLKLGGGGRLAGRGAGASNPAESVRWSA